MLKDVALNKLADTWPFKKLDFFTKIYKDGGEQGNLRKCLVAKKQNDF